MSRYIVISRDDGYAHPYYRTDNHKTALKALEYAKRTIPNKTWTIEPGNALRRRSD